MCFISIYYSLPTVDPAAAAATQVAVGAQEAEAAATRRAETDVMAAEVAAEDVVAGGADEVVEAGNMAVKDSWTAAGLVAMTILVDSRGGLISRMLS